MGRLIGADAFQESMLDRWFENHTVYSVYDVVHFIDEQPTAEDSDIQRYIEAGYCDGFEAAAEHFRKARGEDMKQKEMIIFLHDGGCDGWIFGKDFEGYKVTNNALVLMDGDGAWIAWYNLSDVQKWELQDDNESNEES